MDKRILILIFLLIYCFELIRTAWIGDDAAITLRTVLNFINGYGVVFNVGERVQAYTHPLWFLLISGLSFITGDVFYVTLYLSIGLSIATLWLLMAKVATSFRGGLIAGGGLIFSKAYVDFSTSGLENPLSHFLLVLLFIVGSGQIREKSGKKLILYFLVCSLVYLCRPDLLLLILPFTLFICFNNRRRKGALLTALGVGAIPAIIWTIFSLVYYGFPFPNTAYAKLGSGVGAYALIVQGFRYISDSLSRDALTLCVVLFGCMASLQISGKERCLAAGVVLYIFYVISVGGDFMTGRFFSCPLLFSNIIIASLAFTYAEFMAGIFGIGVLGFLGAESTILSGSDYQNKLIDEGGIADERGFYYQEAGLLTRDWQVGIRSPWVRDRYISGTRRVDVICGGLGFAGVAGGPELHLIDLCGLADPLLARLPAKRDKRWRIGHFMRQLPENYQKSVVEGVNALADYDAHALYDELSLITRSPLADLRRLHAIFDLNIRRVNYNLDIYKLGSVPQESGVPAYSAFDCPKNILICSGYNGPRLRSGEKSLDLVFVDRIRLSAVDLVLDSAGEYRIDYYYNGRFISFCAGYGRQGLSGHSVSCKSSVSSPLTDRIRITRVVGEGAYYINSANFTSW